MNTWLQNYDQAMRRSRVVGILGASIIVLAVVREISRFLILLSLNETVDIAAVRREIYLFGVGILIGALALARIGILMMSGPKIFIGRSLSWIALATSLVTYGLLRVPFSPDRVCPSEGVCFTIYDMANHTDYVAISGFVYILASACRFTVTAVTTYSRSGLK